MYTKRGHLSTFGCLGIFLSRHEICRVRVLKRLVVLSSLLLLQANHAALGLYTVGVVPRVTHTAECAYWHRGLDFTHKSAVAQSPQEYTGTHGEIQRRTISCMPILPRSWCDKTSTRGWLALALKLLPSRRRADGPDHNVGGPQDNRYFLPLNSPLAQPVVWFAARCPPAAGMTSMVALGAIHGRSIAQSWPRKNSLAPSSRSPNRPPAAPHLDAVGKGAANWEAD